MQSSPLAASLWLALSGSCTDPTRGPVGWLLCRSSIQRIIDALASQPSQPVCGLPAVVLEVVDGSQSLLQPCSPLTLTTLQQLAEGATQHWVTAACSRLATAASRLQTHEVYEMVPCSRGG